MKTLIINQNPNGSIHSLASKHHDRKINFPEESIYAVVLASYYGGKGYTTHRTAHAAIKKAKSLRGFSFEIVDSDGEIYDYYYHDIDALIPRGINVNL